MAVSFRHHLVVIWQRRWWVLMSCLLMGAVGTGMALWQSRVYTADAQLVLDARQDPMGGGFMSALNMSTQLEVIKSDKVTSRAATLLMDSGDLQLRAALLDLMKGKAPSVKGLSIFLQTGLTVEPVRGSNVIALTCMAPSPELAVAAVNAVAHAAVDVSIEMKVDPTKESAVWLQGQSKSARAALEAAQAKLSRYQQEKGIVVTDDRMNEESARLSALESALVDAEAKAIDARGHGGGVGSDGGQGAAVASVRAQLSAAELKLLDVSEKLGKEHPQRIALEAQVANLRQRLDAEIAKAAQSGAASAQASRGKVAQLKAMIDAQKKQVLSLRAAHDEISVLQRDVDTARATYESVSQRANQTTLESQSTLTSLRVLNLSDEASDSSKKRRMVRVLGGFAGGFVLAAVAAILLELRNAKVRCLEDFQDIDGISVIGVLHRPGFQPPQLLGLPGPTGPGGPPRLSMEATE